MSEKKGKNFRRCELVDCILEGKHYHEIQIKSGELEGWWLCDEHEYSIIKFREIREVMYVER